MSVQLISNDGKTSIAVVTIMMMGSNVQEVYEVHYGTISKEISMIHQRHPHRTNDWTTYTSILVSPNEPREQKLRRMIAGMLRGQNPNAPVTYPRDMPMGGIAFVWARPRNGNWGNFDGRNYIPGQDRSGFRPVMISGVYSSQMVTVFGSKLSYPLAEFEIAHDVDGAPPMPEPKVENVL